MTDRPDPTELANKLEDFGLWLAERYGDYERAELVADAVWTLRQLIDERDELRDRLATYRVVEVFAATRETPAEYGVRRINNDEDTE